MNRITHTALVLLLVIGLLAGEIILALTPYGLVRWMERRGWFKR